MGLVAAGGSALSDGQARLFTDFTARAGIAHRHLRFVADPRVPNIGALWGAVGGAAAAVGDFNGDGFDDIYVTSSREGSLNRLYRNNHGRSFTDVAEAAGVARLNTGHHATTDALWLDYDNDGALDLFVLRLGSNVLFRNTGGAFTDVTEAAGLGARRMNPFAAVAFDYDNDGDLDLLVGGYFPDEVDLFQVHTTRFLFDALDDAQNGGSKVLYRNNGDGTFTDATALAGIVDTGWTLDIGHGDYDGDGWQDVYIANDFGTDRLLRNDGHGRFVDVTRRAIGRDTKKGMNADFGDYDNDGWLDIYVTNIAEPPLNECNMLWHNSGDGTFLDVAEETGTCDADWGWGAKFVDVDNDGRLDLYVANGLISAGKESYWNALTQLLLRPGFEMTDAAQWPDMAGMSWAGYEQKRLFHNRGADGFAETAVSAGVGNLKDGRGVALLDIENDGALDMFVTNWNQEPILYRNEGRRKTGNNFVGLKLRGTVSNKSAIGARVTATTGGLAQIREVNDGNGYAAQSSFTVHFGLGRARTVDRLEIKWPSGARQVLTNVAANQILTLAEETVNAGPPRRTVVPSVEDKGCRQPARRETAHCAK